MRSVLPALILAACSGAAPRAADVAAVLDDFHDAASKADEARYFAHFAPEGVFLGTDATERWTVEEFRKYAHPHFSKGRGWTYKPRNRSIEFSPAGDVAWFDELLDHTSYGELRGSGALRRTDGAWKIAQYNLAFTVPNDAAKDVVARIRGGPDREVTFEGKSVALSTNAPRDLMPVVFEDDDYSFWSRSYGPSGEHSPPGLWAYRKKTATWMQIRKLATAGATLGRSPRPGERPALPVGWDHSGLASKPFVDLPLVTTGSLQLPQVVRDGDTYKLRFNTSMAERPGLGYMLTEFLIDKRELDRAFLD